jgi:DNA-binding transcriptional LysR family regulator
MELRHLRYFLMIAETGNVRRASENLHVTQPAVSRQLHDLESELGVELFERLPRGLRLNAAGHSYRADVSRLLALLASAGERARRVAAGEAGLLKMGYVEITAWEGIVPDVL